MRDLKFTFISSGVHLWWGMSLRQARFDPQQFFSTTVSSNGAALLLGKALASCPSMYRHLASC